MICKANLVCIWTSEFSLSALMLFSSNFCETLLVEKASALVLFIEVMHMGFNILIYTK